MSQRTPFPGCLVLAVLVFAMALSRLLVADAAEREGYVVLITIDGFPASMFWDAKASLPRIRQLASQGVAAEAMRASNPTVTWPNHTTLVTGVRAEKHSVLFNGILHRAGPGEPVTIDPRQDQTELVAVPTLFDLLHQHGLRTAAIDWPCTRNSDSVDDNFPDTPDALNFTTPRLRQELLAQHILPDESVARFEALSGPGRDEIWTKAACRVIRERQPNLLVLHLLNTDSIHHRYGPYSPASFTALALADTYVGQVLDALYAAGIYGNTTVFVTADHGFANATNILQPNVLLRRAGLLQLGPTNQIAKACAQVIPEGGTGMIYLTNPGTREADRQQVLELFAGKEGIAQVLQPSDYGALGWPTPTENPGMADLVLVAKSGYAIAGAVTGDEFLAQPGPKTNLGYHGYLASYATMEVPFVAAGAGIKHAGKIGRLDNIDVAPTIAHLLGLRLPEAQGKVLTQILAEPD
jgi:arylsulfatase A-like enzyme